MCACYGDCDLQAERRYGAQNQDAQAGRPRRSTAGLSGHPSLGVLPAGRVKAAHEVLVHLDDGIWSGLGTCDTAPSWSQFV